MEFPQILTLHEKHGDYTYLIDSLEELDRASRGIIKKRADQGWFYKPEMGKVNPTMVDYLELTDEQANALPEALRIQALAKRNEGLAQKASLEREFRIESAEWEFVQSIVNNPEESTIKTGLSRPKRDGTRKEITYSKAFRLLDARSDYEYEGFKLQPLNKWPE